MSEPSASVVATLEIAVTGPAGARVARDGGADRVELCTGLELGGLTPSAATVAAVAAEGLPVQALVRCRPGDFVYDAEEIALMAAEIRSVVGCGASGVVVGALTAEGALDAEALRRWRDAAGPDVPLTLHRAVDQSADPVAAAVLAAELGVHRVLTSGGAARALDGAPVLRRIAAAAPRVALMAGGGVTPGDIPALLAAGATAVHLSAKRPAPPRRAAGWVPLGAAGTTPDADTHHLTDLAVVAAARRALDAALLPR